MALVTTLVANKSAPNGIVSRANGYISGTYTAASVNSATAASTTAAATGGIANADAVTNMVIASGVMTITLGFIPKYFKIVNVTDRLTQEWFEGMNTGDFVETAANGTRTLETDDKVSITVATGSHGSSGGGGTAEASATGVVTVTFDGGAATDDDTVVWVAEG